MRRKVIRRLSPKATAGLRVRLDQVDRKRADDLKELVANRTKPSDAALDLARDSIVRILSNQNYKRVDTVDKALFLLSTNLSVRSVKGYATLDPKHIKDIRGMIARIEDYAGDLSQRRPLNILMLASPGAGKSHFIKCLGESLRGRNVREVTCNLAALQRSEDLIPALDAARNVKAGDQLPLLFLDEFDSNKSLIPLLLPLLWDGELSLGQRHLKLGRAIVVLAGSDPSLPGMISQARGMRGEPILRDGESPKIIDLLSRINGSVIEIPTFFDPAQDIDRRADKVCIAVQLLRARFGGALKSAPLALFKFIMQVEFRYGVRSIEHLLELIPYKSVDKHLHVSDVQPLMSSKEKLRNSSLAYHLINSTEAHGVIELWSSSCESEVRLPMLSNVDAYLPYWRLKDLDTDILDIFLDQIEHELTT